jgi:GTP-binding protein
LSRLACVVIAGRPNVGKSTLFNRLLGKRKALVHDKPGVTRDRNVAVVSREGKTFQLVDTGGLLGATEDPLIRMVEEQVEVALAGGDKILLVVDAKDGLIPLERELAARLRRLGKPAALVVNKVDDPRHLPKAAEFHALGLAPVFAVSAEHGAGMDELWDYLTADLPQEEGQEGPAPADAVKVAIVGRPNVGKSSLLNQMLGEERSMVSDIPGTTRDPVDSLLVHEGRPYLMVDTAGIRRRSRTGEGAELLSVILARKSLQNCHVALLVMDASRPPTHQDAAIAGLIEESRRAGLVVLNKWDLVKGKAKAEEVEQAVRERFVFADHLPVARVSAKSGRGVDRLFPAVQRIHEAYSQVFPTAQLNKHLERIVGRASPPSIRGKELKIRYATQTGAAPPILTIFTNSEAPPPEAYVRYLKNQLRLCYSLEGSPLILKFRKE